MNNLEDVLQQTVFQALGWALVHSLWQGVGVAALLAGLLALLRGRRARARYAAGCAALALMLLLPAATAWKMSGGAADARARAAADEAGRRREGQARAGAPEASVIAAGAVEDAPEGFAYESREAGRLAAPGGGFEGVLPWLSLLWAVGVALFSARALGGLAYARCLRSVGTRPAAREWEERLAGLARGLRVRRPVRLLESALVQVPTVVGWLRPVVLLPASALTGLTPRQLEVVLAHELAHIRRHDYLVNLLQTAVETLLFYHPAAWWVAGRVRAEREHVCDDMAVGATGGDALTYARALTALERLRPHARPRLALAADGGSLRARVLRLVGAPAAARRTSPLLAGVAFAAALVTTAACTGAVLSQNRKSAGGDGPGAAKAEAANASREKAGADVAGLSPTMRKLVAGDDTEGEDAEVRRAALEALGKRNGSVVVMDPSTGRVYAVVNQEWAVRRGWLPASTMKVVVGMAGLGERTLDPSQRVRVSDRPGRIDLTDALAFSNNPYFLPVSERVGAEAILAYSRRLGLGELTGINYEGETAGVLPASARGVHAGRLGTHGEGVEVTPVQLAALASAIANGGTLYVPRVPRTPEEAARFEPKVRRSIDIPREILDRITPGLLAAVERGTGAGAKSEAMKVAGKTGSAGGKGHSHGVFYSYAPAERPRMVVVVITEGPGENGREAAGVAGAIYKALGGRFNGGE